MMIEARNLTKRYGTRLALQDVSFHAERGEILGDLSWVPAAAALVPLAPFCPTLALEFRGRAGPAGRRLNRLGGCHLGSAAYLIARHALPAALAAKSD